MKIRSIKIFLLVSVIGAYISLFSFLAYVKSYINFCGNINFELIGKESNVVYIEITGFSSGKRTLKLSAGEDLELYNEWIRKIEILPINCDSNCIINIYSNQKLLDSVIFNKKSTNEIKVKNKFSYSDILFTAITWGSTAGILVKIFTIGLLLLSLLVLYLFLEKYFVNKRTTERNPGIQIHITKDFTKNYLILLVFIILYSVSLFVISPQRLINMHSEEVKAILPALEMKYSNNNSFPSIKGEDFLIKPPGLSYYYFLILSVFDFGDSQYWFHCFNQIPNIFLIIFLFFGLRNLLSDNFVAALTVALFIVSLGVNKRFELIYPDNFYNLFVIISFWAILKAFQTNRTTLYILLSWIAGSFAYMFKGLPALVFLFSGLFAAAIAYRNFKIFILPFNFLGLILFFAIPWGVMAIFGHSDYFFKIIYEAVNVLFFHLDEEYFRPGVLQRIFAMPYGLLTFFFPGIILIFMLFKREIWTYVKSTPLLFFGIILFVFNYIIYSLQTKPHALYLFPVMPFLFLSFTCVLISWQSKFLKIFVNIVGILILLSVIILFFSLKPTNSHLIIFILLISICTYAVYRMRGQILLVAILFLFIFNFYYKMIVPQGIEYYDVTLKQKESASRICKLTNREPVYLLNADTPWNEELLFYLTLQNNRINFRVLPENSTNVYFIASAQQSVESENIDTIAAIKIGHFGKKETASFENEEISYADGFLFYKH
jgi:4-amino-4-deoxy-L-arabinose transferase-like glycosyltransferase